MMKRRIYHYITLLLLLCVSVSSCREMEMEYPGDSMYIELKVSCVSLNETRAPIAGVDNLNENKIESLHYFLYPTGGTDRNAVLAGKIGADKLNGTSIFIPLNEGILNDELIPFPNTTCEVFLIANLPSDVVIDIATRQNTSLPELEDKMVTANFTSEKEPFISQSSFVMTGKGTANLIDRKIKDAVSGTIVLERLAAKYTVRISVDNTFTDPTTKEIWYADVNEMRIHVANAANQTKLSGESVKSYFNYHDRTNEGSVTENNVVKYVFDPFYSYPCQWDLRGDDAFALFIMLPWKKDGDDGYIPYYYKVLPNTTQLNRNTWYNVDLHIGVLGSITQTEAEDDVDLNPNYSVMDWNNGSGNWETGVVENTSIQGARYLIVDQNHYVVNNQDEYEIPFTSSHDCIIKDLSITRTEFGTTNTSKPHPVEINTTTITENIHYRITNDNTAIVDDAIKLEGKAIKLKHTLNNDFINSKTYDYTPYTITFTLCHKDNPEKFKETITITQKPALCVTAHLNSYDKPGQDYCGYVFVNGNSPRSGSNTGSGNDNLPDYGGVQGRNASGNNSNPYMYTIEVSVLPEGSDFIIGDPRVKYVIGTHIAAQENFYLAPQVNGGTNRSLTNYYGTSKDKSIENMIAPKFRVCSAHGWCSGAFVSYDDAFNRAASYQEDGFPAGRWRVPTKAEIQFVHKLYEDELIPPLFYGTYSYWCSTGSVKGETFSNNLNQSLPLRCVYDDWYWENSGTFRLPEGNRNTFTWGDEI